MPKRFRVVESHPFREQHAKRMGHPAMKLDLRVVAAGIEWNAKCIAAKVDEGRTTQGCGQAFE